MFGKKDEMDLAGADRIVDEANRFAVHRAEAEAAISKASRDWHEALEKLGWRQCATLAMRQDLLFLIIRHKYPVIFECFSLHDVWEWVY